MYELDDDKICNDKYWVTLTENTHIKSSGEAAKILKRRAAQNAEPRMGAAVHRLLLCQNQKYQRLGTKTRHGRWFGNRIVQHLL